MPAFGYWLAPHNICAVCLAYCLMLTCMRLLQVIHVCQVKPCLPYCHGAYVALHALYQHYMVFAQRPMKLSAVWCACMSGSCMPGRYVHQVHDLALLDRSLSRD